MPTRPPTTDHRSARWRSRQRTAAQLLLLVTLCGIGTVLVSISRQPTESDPAVVDPWRHTEAGWVDLSTWYGVEDRSHTTLFESFHPVYWAALEFLAVMAALVWCADEVDIRRLLGRNQSNRDIGRGHGKDLAHRGDI